MNSYLRGRRVRERGFPRVLGEDLREGFGPFFIFFKIFCARTATSR